MCRHCHPEPYNHIYSTREADYDAVTERQYEQLQEELYNLNQQLKFLNDMDADYEQTKDIEAEIRKISVTLENARVEF
jgi:hypothetical protein